MSTRKYVVAVILFAGMIGSIPNLTNASDATAESCPDQTTIRADQMLHSADGDRIEVIGNVEIARAGRRLETAQAIYHRAAGRIEIPGPFSLTYPDGDVVYGTRAEFDSSFDTGQVDEVRTRLDGGPGELRGASLVRDGDQLVLRDVTYSPCPVSETNPLPTWRVRASRVEHDAVARDIVYHNPVFEIAGMPVFYLPRLRQPDPTVKRRSGFLIPEMHTGSVYGFGVRVPYHFALAPDRDADITLFYTTRDGAILEGKFRRLFRNGDLRASGSFSHDQFSDGHGQEVRGHLFLDSQFALADHWQTGGGINLASQRGYLRRYDYSDQDRLRNQFYLQRYTRTTQFEARLLGFQTHRDNESGDTLPFTLPDLWFSTKTPMRPFGGDLRFGGDARILYRDVGRRVTSAGVTSEWERNDLLPLGAFLNLFGSVRLDAYSVNFSNEAKATNGTTTTSAAIDNPITRVLPQAGGQLSWPFIRVGAQAVHTVEPFVQAILAPNKRQELEVPNEDSIDVEFDELSLVSRNRFTGRDRIETGNRMAAGLRYGVLSSQGQQLDAVVGQVFRPRELTDFTASSGLRDKASDYVGAWGLQLAAPLDLRLRHRFRVDHKFRPQRNDISYHTRWRNLTLAGTFVYLEGDPDAAAEAPERFGRAEIQNELSTPIDRHWQLTLRHRRDMEHHRSISIGSALEYVHPCFRMDIDINREYTGAENSPAGTTVSISFELLTFGGAE